MSKKIFITEKQLNDAVTIVSEDKGMFAGYKNIASPIIDYIQNYVKLTPPKEQVQLYDGIKANQYIIEIPQKFLSQITWTEDKNIKINVFDIAKTDITGIDINALVKKFTTGDIYISEENDLSPNGKLSYFDIEINALSIDKIVYTNFISSIIYHELTHAYQEYNKLLKTDGGMHKELTLSNYDEIKHNLQSPGNNENIVLFDKINYALLNTTELNAYIAGVYGSLETLKSTRDKFNIDIKRTSAYNMYKDIKTKYMPKLIALDDSYWDMFRNITYREKEYKESPQKFKQRFIKIVDQKLDELMKGIGKVASQYYDDTEK